VLSSTPALCDPAAKNFLTPTDILSLLEKSSTHYSVGTGDVGPLTAYRYWPEPPKIIEFPKVVQEGDHRRVVEFPLDRDAYRPVATSAETLFQTGHLDDAASIYQKALARSPTLYPALLYLGDVWLQRSKPAEALQLYQRAHAINPDDYRTLFFQATALRALGRFDEASSLLVSALALRPRHKPLLMSLTGAGFEISPRTFEPRVLVTQDDKGISIRVENEDAVPWLVYGACKAMWLGEPAHSKKLLGAPRSGWTMTEERECLANLAVAYASQRGKPGFVEDPMIDRILRCLDAHRLDMFILYEIASRMDPFVTLQLDDAGRGQVAEYIRDFVAVPKGAPKQRVPGPSPFPPPEK
jgi:tetratricopeptide (TPR) repeat protein